MSRDKFSNQGKGKKKGSDKEHVIVKGRLNDVNDFSSMEPLTDNAIFDEIPLPKLTRRDEAILRDITKAMESAHDLPHEFTESFVRRLTIPAIMHMDVQTAVEFLDVVYNSKFSRGEKLRVFSLFAQYAQEDAAGMADYYTNGLLSGDNIGYF